MSAEPTTRLWHPFTDMSRIQGNELTLVRGEGSWVWDAEDRKYLDVTAGAWYCNIGHGRKELADAAAAQMEKLAGYQIFDVFANEPARELSDRLSELVPMPSPAVVFFTTGGSDAIDSAAKIARRHWRLAGEPQRTIIVARSGAYHGTNAYGTSLGGLEANTQGWGPLIREVTHVPYDSIEALSETLDREAGAVAAVIGEPVLGAAGVYPPPENYWRDVQGLCRDHNVLLICDEVITGFGRLGDWFASGRFGIEPDMIVVAKGLTSGYQPAGAVLCGPRIVESLWSSDAGPFRHGYTYAGHPVCCAVALANLDVIERERLRERVLELEPEFGSAIGALADHPLVEEVRNIGLLAGVEISADALAEDPDLTERTVVAARERGLLVRNLVGRTLHISPPFVLTDHDLAELVSRLEATLESLVPART